MVNFNLSKACYHAIVEGSNVTVASVKVKRELSSISPLPVCLMFCCPCILMYLCNRCTIYFQFISIINLYMFRAGLLLIIRRHIPVYTVIGICHVFMLTGCWQDPVNSQST